MPLRRFLECFELVLYANIPFGHCVLFLPAPLRFFHQLFTARTATANQLLRFVLFRREQGGEGLYMRDMYCTFCRERSALVDGVRAAGRGRGRGTRPPCGKNTRHSHCLSIIYFEVNIENP